VGDRFANKVKQARAGAVVAASAKTPRGGASTAPGKVPSSTPAPIDDLLSWRLALLSFDHGHRWNWAGITRPEFEKLLAFLAHMEDKNWQTSAPGTENRPRLKSIPFESIIHDAQKEMSRRGLDEFSDNLWELHVDGPTRVWGLRSGTVFRVLWWDPDHKICPSPLKHT
jgi:hypothetical protein